MGVAGLVFGRLFDVVDDEDGNGRFGGLEPEAQVLLDGGEDGRAGVGLRVRGRLRGREAEGEVVASGEAGPVHDRPAKLLRERVQQRGYGSRDSGEHSLRRMDAARIGAAIGTCGRLYRGQPGTAPGDDERVCGELFGFEMSLKMEALREQRPQHGISLAGEEFAESGQVRCGDLGGDVVALRVGPGGKAVDHVVNAEVIGKAEDHAWRHVGDEDAVAVGRGLDGGRSQA